MKKRKLKIGRLYKSENVHIRSSLFPLFYPFIKKSLLRHINCDWGDSKEEELIRNEKAIIEGGKVVSVYNLSKDLEAVHPDNKILVITESDRKKTTIMFPSELEIQN